MSVETLYEHIVVIKICEHFVVVEIYISEETEWELYACGTWRTCVKTWCDFVGACYDVFVDTFREHIVVVVTCCVCRNLTLQIGDALFPW